MFPVIEEVSLVEKEAGEAELMRLKRNVSLQIKHFNK